MAKERLVMLAAAKKLAQTTVPDCSALSESRYTQLLQLPEEKAEIVLAADILHEAAAYLYDEAESA